jgi:magnesium chelatase subunit D
MRLDGEAAFQMLRRRTSFLRSAAGRRDEIAISERRGKYSRSKMPRGHAVDVALDATLRAAAARAAAGPAGPLEIRPEDLREKIRRHRSPFAIVFVVDNSWSVQVETTLERTKGVVLEMLRDARGHRDRVALVAFRHNRRPDATVLLPLTTSFAMAAERLRKLNVSGSTPLPDAIRKAYHILRQERVKYANAIPVMIIITDGLPNVSIRAGGDPQEELALLCRQLPREGIATIVVDTEARGAGASASACQQMAALSRGRYLPLSGLTHRAIEQALGPAGEAGA